MSLQVHDLSKSFGSRQLFNAVNFAVNPGEKVALVGGNGSGKTTIMRIILGEESPDTGRVIVPKGAEIGYLPQEIFLRQSNEWAEQKKSLTLWELASQAFEKLGRIRLEMEKIEKTMHESGYSAAIQDQYDRLHAAFERAGGFIWQAKTVRILKGLGFRQERFHEPLSNLSGGWQMRAYFARLLLSNPDFLLLDEPTNYLDISSIKFLEEYLENYDGAILVVSHDRYFLDKIATSVVALMSEGVRTFRGNYSEFLVARQAWIQEQDAARIRQEREISRIEKFIDRFRYKASKASQVQSRIKMLDKVCKVREIRSTRRLSFAFPECPEAGEVVLRAENISKSFGELKVLQNITFNICRGDRLAIIGENGTGKTTLMRILADADCDFAGRLQWGYRVHRSYFAQDEEISFEKNETVWERMLREAPIDAVSGLRNLLGAFLFSGDDVEKIVRILSGGEKSRLGLARMMLHPCNTLLLDEPTNHLDIAGREALLDALENFPGTIIIVSHDRFFLDCLANRVLALDGGHARLYEGNYSEYLWARQACENNGSETGKPDTSESTGSAGEKESARGNWREKKRETNQKQRFQREMIRLEKEIAELEDEVNRIESELACPPAGIDCCRLSELANLREESKKKLDACLSRWEEIGVILERSSESEITSPEAYGK